MIADIHPSIRPWIPMADSVAEKSCLLEQWMPLTKDREEDIALLDGPPDHLSCSQPPPTFLLTEGTLLPIFARKVCNLQERRKL